MEYKVLKQFVEIFKCPNCGDDFIIDGENFKCKKCGRIVLIYTDIVIFLSQDEWKDFFSKKFNFENYILDYEK